MDDSRRVSSDRIGAADPRYRDLTRRGVNKAYVGAPDYVRLVASTEQVVEAVQDAVREGARIGIRSGGHCLEGFVDDPSVRALIDTSAMTGVHHDPARDAFAVAAGTTLGEVYRRLHRSWGVLEGNLPRLRRIKARYDPANVFRHRMSIERSAPVATEERR